MTPAVPTAENAARAARGVLAAGVTALVALAGHLLGGGSVPPPTIVAAAVVLAWPAAVLLAGPRPRLWRQALTIALGQVLLHAAFALSAGAAAAGGAGSDAGGMGGMGAMPGMGSGGAWAAVPPAGTPIAVLHLPGASMWLGHGAAWLLTVVAWRWGEQVVVRLADLGAGALTRVLLLLAPRTPVRQGTDRPLPARRTPSPTLDAVLLRHPRRGPPVPA